jgi:hypothetical protein
MWFDKNMRKLLAIMLILCSAVFGQKSKLIISVSGELEMSWADVLMDGVSYGLKNNNKYEILINDRQFKETLKKEWDNGNIDDDRIIALAKTAGAAYLCFTKIKSVKGLPGKQVTAHMYNLSTMSYVPGGMGMETIKDDFSDLEDLTQIILNVVADMIGTAKNNSGSVNSGIEVKPAYKKSLFVAIGLDLLGAAMIGYAVYENGETTAAFDRYSERGHEPNYYEDAWKTADSSRSKRNMFYGLGAAVLLSGIGVHIWF